MAYQNEYYYLAGNVTNINNYRKYYEPLIKKDSKNFGSVAKLEKYS